MLYCNSRKTGVYAIVCLATGFWYIGSTAYGFWNRISSHRSNLQKGCHHSPILQKHFEAYGEEWFEVLILEECFPIDCRKLEQGWIDINGVGESNKSYNIASKVRDLTSNNGKAVPNYVYVLISPSGEEYTTDNINRFSLDWGLEATLLRHVANGDRRQHKGWTCRKALESLELQKKRIAASSRVRGDASKREYLITSPQGVETMVRGLTDFCRENNLSKISLTEVAIGRLHSYKGWLCRYAQESEAEHARRINGAKPKGQKRTLYYIVTTPLGEEIAMHGLKDYCNANDLSYKELSGVANGRRSHHKGYRCRHADPTNT